MGAIEKIIPFVQITQTNTTRKVKVEPAVKKYYQKNGNWYAVLQIYANGTEADIHVALG